MIINNEMIPPVEIGEPFIYLRKSFSFDMSTEHVKNELITDFNKYISILNQFPLHPKNKLQVISKFINSKIRWQFSSIGFQKHGLYKIWTPSLKNM